ncbi:MAG: hypothetical protein Q8906_03640 [Bacillota bacterium]|nr:hypothetical protein [Bacillota bacterium]MDP4169679.1 hypothetical protein [Bacillota bacterium]
MMGTYIDEMVLKITEKIYQNDPSLMQRYGEKGRQKCIEDNYHHFKHLQTAYEMDDEKIFNDYAMWLNGILQKFGMSTELLMENFNLIIETLESDKSKKEDEKVVRFIHYLKKANTVLDAEGR